MKRRDFLKTTAGTSLLFGLGSFSLVTQSCREYDFDLVVSGGTILDGTGGETFTADVGIKDGRIAAIEDLAGLNAYRVVDGCDSGRHGWGVKRWVKILGFL